MLASISVIPLTNTLGQKGTYASQQVITNFQQNLFRDQTDHPVVQRWALEQLFRAPPPFFRRSDPTTASTTKQRTPPPRRRPILVTQPTTPVRIPITTPRPSTTVGTAAAAAATKATSTSKEKGGAKGEKRLQVAEGGGNGGSRRPQGSADEGKKERRKEDNQVVVATLTPFLGTELMPGGHRTVRLTEWLNKIETGNAANDSTPTCTEQLHFRSQSCADFIELHSAALW